MIKVRDNNKYVNEIMKEAAMIPKERLDFSADRGPPATAAARRRAHGHLARDRAGGLGRGPPDGAHRDPAAPGPAAAARRAELELARVRDARGALATQAAARAAPHRADGPPQRADLRELS